MGLVKYVLFIILIALSTVYAVAGDSLTLDPFTDGAYCWNVANLINAASPNEAIVFTPSGL